MKAIFNTPEQMKEAIDIYFDREAQHTITGLALALGFCDRQSLYDYQKREGFSCIVKEARTRVEMSYEKCLYKQSNAGAIFALKNMGWTDKIEEKSEQSLVITID